MNTKNKQDSMIEHGGQQVLEETPETQDILQDLIKNNMQVVLNPKTSLKATKTDLKSNSNESSDSEKSSSDSEEEEHRGRSSDVRNHHANRKVAEVGNDLRKPKNVSPPLENENLNEKDKKKFNAL